MSKEKRTLSEVEQKLYDMIKENNPMKMYNIINHEDKRLIGALGKLKNYGLIEITRIGANIEPRKDYRKIVKFKKKEVREERRKAGECKKCGKQFENLKLKKDGSIDFDHCPLCGSQKIIHYAEAL